MHDTTAPRKNQLSSAGQVLAESAWDSFEQAGRTFGDTVDDLDQETTFAEAREQLSSAGQELTIAWDEFVAGVDC